MSAQTFKAQVSIRVQRSGPFVPPSCVIEVNVSAPDEVTVGALTRELTEETVRLANDLFSPPRAVTAVES